MAFVRVPVGALGAGAAGRHGGADRNDGRRRADGREARMNGRLAIPMAAVLCASCVHEKRVAAAAPATPSGWAPQSKNDAAGGGGGYFVKAPRGPVRRGA